MYVPNHSKDTVGIDPPLLEKLLNFLFCHDTFVKLRKMEDLPQQWSQIVQSK